MQKPKLQRVEKWMLFPTPAAGTATSWKSNEKSLATISMMARFRKEQFNSAIGCFASVIVKYCCCFLSHMGWIKTSTFLKIPILSIYENSFIQGM